MIEAMFELDKQESKKSFKVESKNNIVQVENLINNLVHRLIGQAKNTSFWVINHTV